MAVYQQPIMLAEWFRRFVAAGESRVVEVIVVDDCGTPTAVNPDLPNVRLLRLTKRTPWSQGECRNLAAQQANGEVLLMVDPDMTLPPGSMLAFIKAAAGLQRKHVVRPVLRHGNGKLDDSSPNVYLIHREDFLASKGYDLAYCGHKGWSDVTMSQLWAKMFRVSTDKNLVLDFHHGSSFSDAQVTTIDRSVGYNKKIHIKHKERLRAVGVDAFLKEHSPMVSSPWEGVQ